MQSPCQYGANREAYSLSKHPKQGIQTHPIDCAVSELISWRPFFLIFNIFQLVASRYTDFEFVQFQEDAKTSRFRTVRFKCILIEILRLFREHPAMQKPVPPHRNSNIQGKRSEIAEPRERDQAKDTVAIALGNQGNNAESVPRVLATGRGEFAETILDIAFRNGIKVREDTDLAEILAAVELDSEIPVEAFIAVAEILRYVYANNDHETSEYLKTMASGVKSLASEEEDYAPEGRNSE